MKYFLSLLVFLTGCASYQTELEISKQINTIQVNTIKSDSLSDSEIVTANLKKKLSKYYTISDTNADLNISGSAEIGFDPAWELRPQVHNAFLNLSGSSAIGEIIFLDSCWETSSPDRFAEKIAKIIYKAEKKAGK